MDKAHEQEDMREADVIVEELRKLIERERMETDEGSTENVQLLEEAVSNIEKFLAAEQREIGVSTGESLPTKADKNSVVDTGILTGPINGLKSYLMKKSRDQAAQ